MKHSLLKISLSNYTFKYLDCGGVLLGIYMLCDYWLVLRLWSFFRLLASVATIRTVFVFSLRGFVLLKVF